MFIYIRINKNYLLFNDRYVGNRLQVVGVMEVKRFEKQIKVSLGGFWTEVILCTLHGALEIYQVI